MARRNIASAVAVLVKIALSSLDFGEDVSEDVTPQTAGNATIVEDHCANRVATKPVLCPTWVCKSTYGGSITTSEEALSECKYKFL
eukprot:5893430-Amphidinium_carterae.1